MFLSTATPRRSCSRVYRAGRRAARRYGGVIVAAPQMLLATFATHHRDRPYSQRPNEDVSLGSDSHTNGK